MRCLIFSCLSDTHWRQEFTGISSHRFPKKPDRQQQWIDALSRAGAKYIISSSARICSLHFHETDFRESYGRRILKKNAVPCLNLVEEAGKASDNQINNTADIPAVGNRFPFNEIHNTLHGSRHFVPCSTASYKKRPVAMVDIGFDPQVVDNGNSVERLSHGPEILAEIPVRQSKNADAQTQTDDVDVMMQCHYVGEPMQPLQPSMESSTVTASTSREKRIRYAGDIKDVSSLSSEAAKQALPKVLQQLQRSQKRTNRMKQQNIVLRKNAAHFSNVIGELKARNLINSKGEVLLQKYESNSELLKELSTAHRGVPFSDAVRAFATTLCFYSPKAYRFVRTSFNNALPNEKTVARWYRGIDGEPGITAEALSVLESKSKAMASEGRQLMASLSMDEVAIRQLVEWNPDKKKFDGVVNYGDSLSFLCAGDKLIPAKEALVFMVSSVEEDWKMPVAYFLICGLKTGDKKLIVEKVLVALEHVGVKVVGFTFDGTSTNFSVANALGCNLKIDAAPFVTHFQHPSGRHRVYVILDACHMLKLVRNILASQSVLRTKNGEAKWEFIKNLNDFQNLTGLKLAPKLSDHHINFQNQKMKVLLATQTLSKSVSDALSRLKQHDPAFNDSDATAEFISVINNLFDILNTKDFQATGFKKPLNKDNCELVL